LAAFGLIAAFLLLTPSIASAADDNSGGSGPPGQPAINLIFDMHADPIPDLPWPEKVRYYNMQVDNGRWVLDRIETLDVKVSFLSCGQFMEFVVLGGPAGQGAEFLRNIYAAGRQIGSHSHTEFRRAAFDWPALPHNATFAQSRRSWRNNIDWVNAGIETALGDPPPEPLDSINSVKGAHLPATEAEYHHMMELFDIEVREGGPEEDYYGIYDHYILNPYRPSKDNTMGEDLKAPFVVIPQGSVIGKAGIHHGTYQDMTASNVKRLFIQAYLNWRYRDRKNLGRKVWVFGWGSHNHDFAPQSRIRADLVEMIRWLDANFAGKKDATGSLIARWNTQKGAAREYFHWEAAHPGKSSFDSNGTDLDWKEYPYLRAACAELREAQHVADLHAGGGVRAWRLKRGSTNIVVALRDHGRGRVDFSHLIQTPCRIVGAETGLLRGTDPASVPVGAEPVIVTEAAPVVTMSGRPVIGKTVFFTIKGEPGARGSIFKARRPASINVPHLGTIRIDPFSGMRLLGMGAMHLGVFTQSFEIPFDPALIGSTFFIQGVEKGPFATTFTVNSVKMEIEAP